MLYHRQKHTLTSLCLGRLLTTLLLCFFISTKAMAGTQDVDQLNFTLDLKDPYWVSASIPKSGPATPAKAYRHIGLPLMLVVNSIPDIPPALTPSQILEQIIQFTVADPSRNNSINHVSEISSLSAKNIGGAFYFANGDFGKTYNKLFKWVAKHNGFGYEITLIGNIHNGSPVKIDEVGKNIVSEFSINDLNKQNTNYQRLSLSHYNSPKFGYQVTLGPGWHKTSSIKTLPGAELAVEQPGTSTIFIAVTADLLDNSPSLNALTSSMLNQLDIEPATSQFLNRQKISHKGIKALELDYQRDTSLGEFISRFRVMEHNGIAYLFAMSTKLDNKNNLEQLFSPLNNINLDSEPPAIDIKKLTAAEALAHKNVHNNIGLYLFEKKRYRNALSYFLNALDVAPNDETILFNTVQTYSYLKKYQEGIAILESHLASESTNSELLSYQAYFHQQLGNIELALLYYAQSFDQGHTNEHDLQAYAQLLSKAGKTDKAFQIINDYLEAYDSIIAQRTLANLYIDADKPQEAIIRLQALREQMPFDEAIAIQLIGIYYTQEQHHKIIELSGQLIEEDHASSDIWYYKGRSQYQLGWYNNAKLTFESLLQIDPTSQNAKDYITHISSLIGEGDNSDLKAPIRALTLPKSLDLKTLNPPSNTQLTDFGAYYIHRIKGYHFEEGEKLRQTQYLKIKILNEKGMTRFSDIQLSFNPFNESIYINELTIRDEQGEIVAQGNVDNYYVMDDSSSGMATQDKNVHIPIPSLAPGHTIELIVTKENHRSSTHIPYKSSYLSSNIPVQHAVIFTQGDLSNIKILSNTQTTQQQKTKAVYLWHQHWPPIYAQEPFQQRSEQYLPTVSFSDKRRDWQQEGDNYLNSIQTKLQTNASILALATELSQGLDNNEQKIKALTHYVQTKINYQAIEFGTRGYTPNSADETLDKRYGDCKDHAVLLQQLSQAAGIKTSLLLVNNRANINKALPSVDQFNHMIVYCDSCQHQFIDTTDKDVDANNTIPWGLAGSQALLLENDSRLISIPQHLEGKNDIYAQRHVSVKPSGQLDISETLTLYGHMAAYFRSFFRGQDSARYSDILQQRYGNISEPVIFQQTEVLNLNDASQPLKVIMDYQSQNTLLEYDDKLMGKFPTTWEELFIAAAQSNSRKSPFEIIYPITFNTELSISHAAEITLDATKLPRNVQKQGNFFIRDSIIQGRQQPTSIKYKVKIATGDYPASQYQQFASEANNASSYLSGPFVFQKTKHD